MANHKKSAQRRKRMLQAKELWLKGVSTSDIAKELKVSKKTVEDYFSQIEQETNSFSFLLLFLIKNWNINKILFTVITGLITLFLVLLIFVVYALGTNMYTLVKVFFEMLWGVLKPNLGHLITVDVLIAFIIIVVLLFSLSMFLILWKGIILRENVNWWVWGTIQIMFFFFFIGLFVINNSTTNDLAFGLNDERKNLSKAGVDLLCEGESERLLYESKYFCDIKYPNSEEIINLENQTGIIFFNGIYGQKNITFEDRIEFEVPSNTTYILFTIQGFREGSEISWSSGRQFNFISKNEEEEIRRQFLSDLFILFTLVFFSIPTMMLSFKHLSKREDNK